MSVCGRYGRENPDESRFCNHCGAEIVPVPAAAVEELKVVTVLFADITGSTALGERLDAEGLKEVTAAFFAAMRVEIEAEGGTVEKFIGDAVMAAFGGRACTRTIRRAPCGPRCACERGSTTSTRCSVSATACSSS